MLLKNKSICFGAGKIILAISIVLWFMVLWSWGKFNNAETIQFSKTENAGIPQEELDNKVAAYQRTPTLESWEKY
jgi:ferrous iron transport protein B